MKILVIFIKTFLLFISVLLTISCNNPSKSGTVSPPSISHLMEDTISYFSVPSDSTLSITFHHVWMEGNSTFRIYDINGEMYKEVSFSDNEDKKTKEVSLKTGVYKTVAFGTGFSYDLKFNGEDGNWRFVVATFPNKGIFRLVRGESVKMFFNVQNKSFRFFVTEEFEQIPRTGYIEVYDDKDEKKADFSLVSNNLDNCFQQSIEFKKENNNNQFWYSILYGDSSYTAKLGFWIDKDNYTYPTELSTLITPKPEYYFIPNFNNRHIELKIKGSNKINPYIGAAEFPINHSDDVINYTKELSLKTFNKSVSWSWRERDINGNPINDDNDPFHINWDGFDFSEFDKRFYFFTKLGISPILTLKWDKSGFLSKHPALWNKNDMEEYAEFSLATVIHCVAPDSEESSFNREPYRITGIQLLGEPNILLEEKLDIDSSINKYIEILKTVGKRIKNYPDKRVRDVKIIGPGIGTDNLGEKGKVLWTLKILKEAGDYIDIISWDEYYKWLLEELDNYGADVKEVKKIITDRGYNKELCMSEFNLKGGIPTSQYFFGSKYSEIYLFGAISNSIKSGMKYPIYYSLVDSRFEPRFKGLISSQPMPPYSNIPPLRKKPQFYSMKILGKISEGRIVDTIYNTSQFDAIASYNNKKNLIKIGLSNRYESTSDISVKIDLNTILIENEKSAENFKIKVYDIKKDSISLLYELNKKEPIFQLTLPPWSIYYIEVSF